MAVGEVLRGLYRTIRLLEVRDFPTGFERTVPISHLVVVEIALAH